MRARAARRAYADKLAEQRRGWVAAVERERAEKRAEETAARERREAARRDKKAAREARAAAARERREAEKAEASVRRRERIGRASAALDGERAERIERQERLVEALEDEAKHWLVDDATIDAKITPELFSGPPASTGLVTRESRAWWRYAAQVDGRPDLSAEDELLLNRDEEATRVATTTERLIRTQAAHPREFHRVLDDGAAIAEAIADLDVRTRSRAAGRGGRPPPGSAFLLFNNADVPTAPGRAGIARRCRGRASVGSTPPLLRAPARRPRGTDGRMRAPAHVEVLQADRALERCWRGRIFGG